MREKIPKEDRRYKFGLTLLIPLGEGVFSEGGYPCGPLDWHSWGQYRDPTYLPNDRGAIQVLMGDDTPAGELPDLTVNATEPPWIRLPGQCKAPGRQPQPEVFLKHIEELLYPGMAILRHSVAQPGKDSDPTLSNPPTRRWIGLPQGQERIVIDFANRVPRSSYSGTVELTVDAGEVFEANLGPRSEESGFGPMVIGILHLSFGTDQFEASDRQLQELWGATLIQDIVFTLSQPVIELSQAAVEASSRQDALQSDAWHPVRRLSDDPPSNASYPSWLKRVEDVKSKGWFTPLIWLAAIYFGRGLMAGDEPRILEGTHFVVQVPAVCLCDTEGDADLDPHKFFKNYGPKTDKLTDELTKLAALARDDERAVATDVTGRIRAATTYRGTALLNKGKPKDPFMNQLGPVEDDSFLSLNPSDLRNLRSYWLQGILLAMTQHQLIKRFSNQLGLTGGGLDVNRLSRQYGEWLMFRNSVWWTDITYSRPPSEKLLKNYRDGLQLERAFDELSGDFETYTGFAEREHDKAIGRNLRFIQVLGAGVVAFGIGGAAAEITNQFDGGSFLGIWVWVAVSIVFVLVVAVLLLDWDRDFREPWRSRRHKK